MDPTHQDTLDQIYAGARQAGVDISGLLSERSVHSDEFSESDRLSLTVHLDAERRPTAFDFGQSFRLEVFKDGLEWRADVSEGDTVTTTTARSPSEVTRKALVDSGIRPNLANTPSDDAATLGDDVSDDLRNVQAGTNPFPAADSDDETEGGPGDFEPEISLYLPREETPYTGGDVEEVERDPVSRSVPDAGAGDDEEERQPRRVARVPTEPAFDEPGQRRLEGNDDSMLMRLVKFGVPLLVAVVLVIVGINVFGDDTPDPVAGSPISDEEVDDGTAQDDEDPGSDQNEPDPPAEDEPQDAVEDPPIDEPSEEPLSRLLQGSYRGPLSFDPVGDGAPFDSEFLLSILDELTVDAVFPPDQKLRAEQIAGIVGEDVAFDAVALGVILSQDQPSGIAQNTYGVIAGLGDGSVRIDVANEVDTYTEGYSIVLTPCQGFPVGCETLMLAGISFGGPPGLDFLLGLSDAASANGSFQPSQDYGWVFRVTGTLTRESGQGS